MTERLRTWRDATERALYGQHGFFREHAPRGHFRTSVHASPMFAEAILTLANEASLRAVVDIGAGRGELLDALRRLDPGLTLVGVELADRPSNLPRDIEWTDSVPTHIEALVIGNEWLDNIPVDVVEQTDNGWRLVLVSASGAEQLGPPPDADYLAWLERWWPAGEPGDRAELGRPRDARWAQVIASLTTGIAVAIDYAHTASTRPSTGTLTGYRDGRQVAPVPDGSTDITSHVALDACAEAGERAGATATVLTTQRKALHALGVRGERPEPDLARTDPPAYLAALARAGEAAELTDPAGLGGFGWLVQGVAAEIPQAVTGTDR